MNSDLKREVSIVALSESQSQPGYFALILEDMATQRRIPVVIGHAEAQAIAIALEQMTPLRPLTHDLLKNTIIGLGATVTEVLIHELKEGVFHSFIVINNATGQMVQMDARTSDAIALAVRFDAPIYTYEHIIEEAGILAEAIPGETRKGSIAEYSIEELENLLARVIAKEDYESAARIRDYLDRRRAG